MVSDTTKYTILQEASVIDVLKKLNELPILQTVFVIDQDNKVIGTITDGDIRRGLINGLKLEDKLDKFVFRNFKYLVEDDDNFKKLTEFRQKRIKAVPLLDKKGKLLRIYDFTKIKSILPIEAVIMAGGEGKRLRPMTLETPKPLLEVGSKAIIDYNVERLLQFGIEDLHITVNYKSEKIEEHFEKKVFEANIHFINEDSPLGTFGAVTLIPEFNRENVLVMNSDLLTNIDYQDFYKSFVDKGADLMVASIPYEMNLPYAVFETEERIIKSFKEKPKYTHYANAGIYLMKKEIISLVTKNSVYHATDLMQMVMEKGYRLLHYPIRSYWLDIGKPEDYEKAQKDIAHINWE